MKTLMIILFLLPVACPAGDSTQSCRRLWLIPDYGMGQYAGSIGMISAGPGYYIAGRKVELSLLAGYTPSPYGSDLLTGTLKLTYKPFKVRFDGGWSSSAIHMGVYASQTFGSNYWLWLPDRYPRDYYWWSVGMRPGIYLGTSVRKQFNVRCDKGAEVFFEAGTHDLYLFSYLPNADYFSFLEIIRLGWGVRVDF